MPHLCCPLPVETCSPLTTNGGARASVPIVVNEILRPRRRHDGPLDCVCARRRAWVAGAPRERDDRAEHRVQRRRCAGGRLAVDLAPARARRLEKGRRPRRGVARHRRRRRRLGGCDLPRSGARRDRAAAGRPRDGVCRRADKGHTSADDDDDDRIDVERRAQRVDLDCSVDADNDGRWIGQGARLAPLGSAAAPAAAAVALGQGPHDRRGPPNLRGARARHRQPGVQVSRLQVLRPRGRQAPPVPGNTGAVPVVDPSPRHRRRSALPLRRGSSWGRIAKPKDGISGCCPAQTGDHIVPKSSFFEKSVSDGTPMPGWSDYKIAEAPCMCLEGGSCTGSHGLRHAHHKAFSPVEKGTHVSFDDEVKHCAKGAKAVAPQCSQACLEAQLKEGHKGMGDQSKPVKHSPTGKNYIGRSAELLKKIKDMLPKKGRVGR